MCCHYRAVPARWRELGETMEKFFRWSVFNAALILLSTSLLTFTSPRGRQSKIACLFACFFPLECSSLWKYLPAANSVPEFFSHNTQSSHPELSELDSLSSRANKSLGMLSEAEGRSLPSRLRCLLTLSLPFSVSHNKESWRTRHRAWIGRPQSVTDHLRMYYSLLPKHDQKPWALNLFGFVSR